MERGEIWWATLPDPIASEPGYSRPVVIVQDNRFNRSAIETIVVAAITSHVRLAEAVGNVLISGRHTGLRTPSVVNVSQIVTADRSFFTERIGRLTPTQMDEVDTGLRLVLGLY